MSDLDIAVLVRALDLVTHMHPKLSHSPASLGVARLDFDSSLFLERGSVEGNWVLEGRTWGHPPRQAVHDWHLRATAAARRLDSTVPIPGPLAPTGSMATPAHPPGRVAHRHSAGPGRRLLSLR